LHATPRHPTIEGAEILAYRAAGLWEIPMSEPVQVACDGAIATVVLSNPGRLNALTRRAWQMLGDAMLALSADDAIRCVVLRGAGEAFAAGADIAEFANERADAAQAMAYDRVVNRAARAIADCRHPTVAMIIGPCIGGGLEIAAVCDLRICGESSRFGVPINRLGLTIAYPELKGLLALAGRATTLEILLEGRVMGAAEAHAKGLVTRVVADDRVEAEALATARRIADGAPQVNRCHKAMIRRLEQGNALSERDIVDSYAVYDSADFRAGVAAFIAKTKPSFEGR
jgi:enoyl-CoA hydratase/carnithine racemase